MKLQGMTIVYVLIILPIFFVVSIVISTQIQIINARLDYDKKVLGAAQDAIKSFEINTANEEFSKVLDVLRSIVEASVNVFKDSLGTKLGMSNENMENKILAMWSLVAGLVSIINMTSKNYIENWEDKIEEIIKASFITYYEDN